MSLPGSETIELNAPGGLRDYCERFGPTMYGLSKLPVTEDLWSDDNIDKVAASCGRSPTTDEIADKSAWREGELRNELSAGELERGGVFLFVHSPRIVAFERIEIEVLNLEVVVSDRDGIRAEGLDLDDFSLTVDGEPVEISNFYVGQREIGSLPRLAPPPESATSSSLPEENVPPLPVSYGVYS